MSLLLVSSLLSQAASTFKPVVGGFVLLTDGAALPHGEPRAVPTLTDAQGRPVSRSPWLNRPIQVVREMDTAYLLAQGQAHVWLPKRRLETKSVFPLVQTLNSRAMAQKFSRATVSVNGQPLLPCEVVAGYHALVTLKTARVASTWFVMGNRLEVSPQGGLAQGDLVSNERVSGQAVLVMLTPTTGVRFMGAALDPELQNQSAKLMARVSQRCTELPALYASTDDVYRSLSTARSVRVPTLPNDPDAQQHALIGWTKAQVLAQYGSPNEPGSLGSILKLKAWTYGADAYSMVWFNFGADGRVSRAVVSRSP